MSMKWSVPILIVVLLSLMASSALSMRLMGDDDLINPLEPRRQIEPWRIQHCRQLCQGHRHPRKCEEECENINGFDDESSKEVDTRSRDPHQEFRQCRRRCQTQQEGGRQQRMCEQRCEKQLERQQGYDDEEFGQGRSNIGAPVRSNDYCHDKCGEDEECEIACLETTTNPEVGDPRQKFRQCLRHCETQEEARKCEQRCEKQLERQQGYDGEEFGQGRKQH